MPPLIDNFFVCVGAQKSGTTWLARVLSDHPELFLTPVKEIHYFDHVRGITAHLSHAKRRSRYRKYHQRLWTQLHRFSAHRAQWAWYRDYMRDPVDDDWYAALFRHRGTKRFAGEVTPEYAIIGRDGFEHIRRLAPAARVLFIMRNPVTRAWSHALHHCRSEGLDAMRQTTAALVNILGQPHFQALGNYPETLDNMRAVFPPDQTLTLFYEDMHRDRAGALEQVCRFIGIGFDASALGPLDRRFNRGQEVALPEPVRAHLRKTFGPVAEAVRQRIGRIPEAWSREFEVKAA